MPERNTRAVPRFDSYSVREYGEAGGWKNARTLQTVYQASDPAGVLRVVLDATELREERG